MSAETNAFDVSIIIPMYNEMKVLEHSVAALRDVMDRTRYSYEIVMVDDVSRDGTPDLARKLQAARPENTSLYLHEKNAGRGQTVTDGIGYARGEFVGFIDIDLATQAWYIPEIVARLKKGADFCMARRVYKVHPRIMHRWILSRGYHYLMRFMLGVNLGDTETGCKFFRREKILPVLNEIQDRHWFWDTEICVRSHFRGLKLEELPTLYIRRPETGSTVKILRDSWQYFLNLLRFRKEVVKLRARI